MYRVTAKGKYRGPPSPLIKFRELLARPRFIPALGIWDPYTARVAEAFGIECVHIGGYQLGAHYVTSEPLLTLTELAHTTRYVTAAVRIPVVVDAGAGYGEPLHVMRTVRELERAGAAGLCTSKTRFIPSAPITTGESSTWSRGKKWWPK
ncbi:MAG: hypothetical protein A3F74_25730 [Betaproteobacteria bacterium RIFCSPLOWO2_12_FULL_62_58]|nr:MAG: hypothetical protein A3F74_25730 [Betaproteobacteria bacterium RIFCSPLOWO2_12_FULL_62_58]